ncbi:MAG: helix-turn-helix domain-containing protein [Nitrospirales bacterium]|nr:helix-turn-helix domain-containing protein [Nitrospirales bacterium]
MDDGNLVNVHRAAKFLGVKKDYIYRHPEIPRRKVGRKLRFSLRELDEWTKIPKEQNEIVHHRKALYR